VTAEQEHEPEGPVIRDKRRIDPQTGQVREPRTAAAPSGPGAAQGTAATDGSGPGETAASQSDAAATLAERTADLQRLQAEYLNYKRRVDRDRETARHNAIGSVLSALLPVLDDINRAREHDELSGGFKAVAESLERTVESLGLRSFGEPGEPFDPRIHEALMHSYSGDVTEPVSAAVLQVGYRHGDRILRPARVAVAEPPAAAEASAPPVDGSVPAAADDADTDLSDGSGPTGSAAPDNSGRRDAGSGSGATDAGDSTEKTTTSSQ
jgi:molecular chaperone GrpE